MGAADEIPLMYAMNRAYFPTFTARYTFIVIYSCEIIYYLDCLGGAYFFALSAGYAAVLTELANLCALIVVITLYDDTGYVIYQMNYAVGTGALAKTAAYTFFRIYFRYSALGYGYRVTRADLCAVTVSEAGKGAEAVAREAHISRLTGLRTAIDILSFLGLAGSVTGNVSHALNNVLCLNAENFGDFLCRSVSARNT